MCGSELDKTANNVQKAFMRTAAFLGCFTIFAGCTGHQTFDDGSDAVEQTPGPDLDAGSQGPSTNDGEPASPNDAVTPSSPEPQAPDSPVVNNPGTPQPGPAPSATSVGPQPSVAMPGPISVPECGECIRAIACVPECGGPVQQVGCCACEEGTFDSQQCTLADAGVDEEPTDAGTPNDGDGGTGGTDPSAGGASNAGSSNGGATNNGGSAGGAFELADLNSSCVDGECPEGLTPIRYYGIAGEEGPLFCSCSIACEEDPDVCPEGSSCVTISDGPGTVCY